MIGTALKSLAAQLQLTVSSGMAYGYLQGSYVTLTDHFLCRRMSIYAGCVEVPLPEGEEQSPAAKCAALIAEMVTKGSGDENIYALVQNPNMPSVVLNHASSVVTINFRKDAAGMNGLQRFIAEMLPRITPLTAPLQCACCGGHTQGQGYPVRIAADTVVPMHAECLEQSAAKNRSRLPDFAAVLGAAVGALLGAFVWALIFHAGYISALGALVILLLTLGGYVLLGGKPGMRQNTVLLVCMFAAIFLGTVGEYLWSMHEQYISYGSVVSDLMKESVYMRIVIRDFFTDFRTLGELLLNIGIGFVIALPVTFVWTNKEKGCAPSEPPKALPGTA